MNSATFEYQQKVWQFLDKMKPGERYTVSKICEKENIEKFTGCIKQWMEKEPWQGWVSFNADYTEFYKTHAITFKK